MITIKSRAHVSALQVLRGPAGRALRLAMPFLLAALAPGLAGARSHTVLYTFTGGADGMSPYARLIRDSNGNLYGTTFEGGAYAFGTVFKVDPVGKQTVLHSFDGADGLHPLGSLIRDKAGNLYGTTSNGGTPEGGKCRYGCGTVFKINTSGKEKVLYAFSGGADGRGPEGGLVRDSDGGFYGTTGGGGDPSCSPPYGCGLIFKLDRSGNETVLHAFAATDGAGPDGHLIRDKAGNLYGTTSSGGDLSCDFGYGCGTVFVMDRDGQLTVLYMFTGTTDGRQPVGGVIRDPAGNLYGATSSGGDPSCNCGVIFRLDPSGTFAVLYTFTEDYHRGYPSGPLSRDAHGNLYGTTQGSWYCSSGRCGTVFKLHPTGEKTILYEFSGRQDGSYPTGGVVRDELQNLYGITDLGGDPSCGFQGHGCGVVFKISP